MNREAALVQTFVDLADTLVDDFDIVDLLTALSNRCVEVLDVSTVGIMLVDANGELRAMASSSEVMRIVELFELQSQEGPCLDCYRSGEPVDELLATATARWPTFAPVALDAGFRAAAALPMRLRDQVIGALNLFQTEPRALSGDDTLVAQRPRRHRHDRHPATPQDRRSRRHQRSTQQRPHEPDRHRAGQGHRRRTRTARHARRVRPTPRLRPLPQPSPPRCRERDRRWHPRHRRSSHAAALATYCVRDHERADPCPPGDG